MRDPMEGSNVAPLDEAPRRTLESGFGTDLGRVRIHTGDAADRSVRSLGAEAYTVGNDIFFREDTFRPSGRRGMWLLAHEVAHTLQQRTGVKAPARAEDELLLEYEACLLAERVVSGPERAPACELTSEPTAPFVQRHASWEHRLLGDAAAADLDAIANNGPQRQQLLETLLAFLNMWHTDPLSVTEQMIAQYYPSIRPLRLDGTNLLVTYGEVNTLPDYLSNPGMIFGQSQNIMLPILQAVRQEGYNKINGMLGGVIPAQFSGAVSINTGWSFMDLIVETKALDSLTWNLGPNHTDHYTALVARNACHFAPFSWYRWREFFEIAQAFAVQAYGASNPTVKQRLTYMAWINLGYADHFLQDSFAAGHLVNKNLIMQWFVEWAAGAPWYVTVADWNMVKNMTTSQQPGLSAQALYQMPAQTPTVADPQTAEDQGTLQGRMNMCGVQADGSTTQAQAYQNYLAWLNGVVIQSASGVLHDYFNSKSLWVASTANPQPFQIWGDDTMLNGGDGVRIACETAHQSQQSVVDLLTTGTTNITWNTIFNQFPTSVRMGDGTMKSLQQWQLSDEVKNLAWSLFPAVHYWVLRLLQPRIGYVSVDSPSAIGAPAAAGVPTFVN